MEHDNRDFRTALKLFMGVTVVFTALTLWFNVEKPQETKVEQDAVKTMPPRDVLDSPGFIEHTVEKGESINAIAKKYTVLPWQVRAANGMDAEDALIHPGDVINVPVMNWSHRTYTGKASWYGPGFHGKKRADGEVYDQNEILVAHRTLPLGLKVKIVNLENGKTIVAEIKDRGPYTKDERGRYKREIDLSRGAAKKLGALEPGVIPVKIQPLG